MQAFEYMVAFLLEMALESNLLLLDMFGVEQGNGGKLKTIWVVQSIGVRIQRY